MKKKYFYGVAGHIKVLISYALVVASMIRTWDSPSTGMFFFVTPPMMIVFMVLIYINCLSVSYIVVEEGVYIWSFMIPKHDPIKWGKITHIEKSPHKDAHWLHKFPSNRMLFRVLLGYTVSIRAKGFKTKEIWVMSGIHKHKELLQTVIEKAKDNPGIVIDPQVVEYVNRKRKCKGKNISE